MTLNQKIGQMIMVGFQGKTEYDEGVQRTLHQVKSGLVGGVIFFSHNIESPEQIQKLTAVFRKAADLTRNDQSLPLLLAVDQEGGKVQRLNSKNGHEGFLSAYEVAENFQNANLTTAYVNTKAYYFHMAEQTRNAGFNTVLGPVVDLHTNPMNGKKCPVIGGIQRSFSADPIEVVNFAKAFIDAHHEHGLLTATKHGPLGHGGAYKGDTHQGAVDITETFCENEKIPFINLIKDNDVDMMMTAHVIHKKIDKHPATLSEKVLQSIVRQEMNFNGVIISDDLHMGAIRQHYSLTDAVKKYVQAGGDIILLSNDKKATGGDKDFQVQDDLSIQVHQIIKEAIQIGEIDENLIHKSYKRILTLKKKLRTLQ